MAARKLTARFVETVTTTRARKDIRDSAVEGLQLRVTAQGTKTWSVRYTRVSDGRRRRSTLGTYPNLGLEKARQQAREELTAVARGADPAGERHARKAAETFGQVAVEWVWRHGRPNGEAAQVSAPRIPWR